MDDLELEKLLDDIESDRVERTISFTKGDKFRQVICAFANDLADHRKPGILFVGVDDNGVPTGELITDQLLQSLAAIRDDGQILPLPSLDVQKRHLKGKDVAVVIVHPSSSPPVKFQGVVWIRSGARRGRANAEDERRLSEKRRHRDLPPDIRPLESATLDDLDELLFRRTYLPNAVAREVLLQNERNLEHQYIAARFAHPAPPIHPTMVGILAVGKDPTVLFPGAYVQFLRIDGTQLADPIKNSKEIRGPLPDLLAEIDEIIRANLQIAVDFTSENVEIRKADYPIAAVQQIIRNAVMHRNYEGTSAYTRLYWFNDRIEIQSPGGPYGQVTKQNFGTPGAYDYRNPNLASVMKEMGYVQRFGIGIATARQELHRNGNPPLEFQIEDSFILTILWRRS